MANRALVWNSGGQRLVEMKGLQNRYLKIQMQTQASKNLVKSSVKNKETIVKMNIKLGRSPVKNVLFASMEAL